MTTFDVREENNEEITMIVFAEEEDADGDFQACTIVEAAFKGSGYICIYDTYDRSEESVSISSIEHAENLVKALSKAIELGWIK